MNTVFRLPEAPGILRPHKRFQYQCVGQVLHNERIQRKTKLIAPMERIEDHSGEVFTCEFHPRGELLLSAGIKSEIHICSVYEKNDCVMIMQGHWCAVMEAHFSLDGESIYSCSSDQTLGVWDTFTGIRIARLKGHMGCVNTVQRPRNGVPILCSGGDDATVRVWDVRQGVNAMKFDTRSNVISACFNEDGVNIFTGSIGSDINTWDIRMCDVALQLNGHKDAVSGLSLSPCGNFLLSNSLDCTLRIWDIRPSQTRERCLRIFPSNQHFVNGNLLRCAWAPDGSKISAGSSDEEVSIFCTFKGTKLDDLPGHNASVNDVDFHPSEEIVASASADHFILLHEILEY